MGVGIIGSLIDAGASMYSANKAASSITSTNRTNIDLQNKAQAFDERMSSTAMQRRVDDLTKAGGNPALAFTNGESASSPVVTPAHVDAPYGNLNLKTNFAQGLLIDAQVKNLNAQTTKTGADTNLANAQAAVAAEQAKATAAQTGSTTATTGRTEAETAKIQKDTELLTQQKQKLIAEIGNLGTQGQILTLQKQIAAATKQQTIDLVKNHLQESNASAAKASLISRAIDAFNNATQSVGETIGGFIAGDDYDPNAHSARSSGRGNFQKPRSGR
ncbi:DNA pilot protein [Blackfly microvirus SF02]|uniref:DNA pilot protein n=1 Tax=Blackfly microvirus SF02 TaxID=2576452 RepID=A0A4P8PLX6_9VIRU|nr:DNA pilot protein [Blackfly microvirus SF02]